MPITQMFTAGIVWRGIVYTILMLFAKLVTGLWLIKLHVNVPMLSHFSCLLKSFAASCVGLMSKTHKNSASAPQSNRKATMSEQAIELRNLAGRKSTGSKTIDKPMSLYPAAILGTAMTARGEIGFLIASLAETTGLFQNPGSKRNGSSEIYLVVVWAVLLCTILGPLSTGLLVKRVKKLEKARQDNPTKAHQLGTWGVN